MSRKSVADVLNKTWTIIDENEDVVNNETSAADDDDDSEQRSAFDLIFDIDRDFYNKGVEAIEELMKRAIEFYDPIENEIFIECTKYEFF